MQKELNASELISLDSISLGKQIDVDAHVTGLVLSCITSYPNSKYVGTAYLIVEDPDDSFNTYFFSLFEDDNKNVQGFILTDQEMVNAFLDKMKEVSKNVKINNIREFIREINHEIEIDSDKGKYFKSCKGLVTVEN